MNQKISSFRIAMVVMLAVTLIVISAAAQSVVKTIIFNSPDITNNIGFDFEAAVVRDTGLVYIGATGAYGSEVGVIDPTTNAIIKVISLSTGGFVNFARVNQTTKLVYFRQPNSNIVVIDAEPTSATYNQALAPLTLPNQVVQSFELDEMRGLLYVTNNTLGPPPVQSHVTIIDANPASATFHQVVNQILLPTNALARGVGVNSSANKIYLGVTGPGLGGVYVLDGATLTLIKVPGTIGSFGVAVNENSNLIYATAQGNQLNAVDGVTDTTLAVIPLPGFISAINFDEKVAVHKGTGRVYIQTSEDTTPGKVLVVDGNRLSPTFNNVLAAIPVGRAPGAGDIAVDENLNRIITTGFFDKRTSIIDGATNSVIAVINSTQTPSDIALDPATHRAYVANQLNFVQEIDVGGAALETTILTAAEAGLGVVNPANHLFYVGRTVATTEVQFFDKCGVGGTVAGAPHDSGRYVFAVANRNTNRVYALNAASNLAGDTISIPGFISVIDANSNTVIANVEVGNQPFGIGINEATNKIYVSNVGQGAAFPGSITVIDGATNTATTADTTAFPVARFFSEVVANEMTNRVYFQVDATSIGVLDGATNIATPLPNSLGPVSAIRVNKILNRVYVVSEATGLLHVLDGTTEAEIATLSFGSPNQQVSGQSIAVNETTGRVFVTNFPDDTLTVIDGSSNTVVATIPVSDGPRSVAVNALTNRVYVGNRNARTISFINGASLAVETTLTVPLNPAQLVVDKAESRVYVSSSDALDQSGVLVVSDFPQELTALGPAQIWLGLKNSDDVGTKFDLLAEVLRNGAVIGSGQVENLPGGSSGFNNAILRTFNLALSGPVRFSSGDTLSIRLSVRIAANSGHRSGTARLWYNDPAANSQFSATIDCVTSDYFLLDGFALSNTTGSGPKKTIDIFVNRAVGGNPFKPFGTWSKTF